MRTTVDKLRHEAHCLRSNLANVIKSVDNILDLLEEK